MTREHICRFRRYATAWEVGTGLRVALPPGNYLITGEKLLGGISYLYLNEVYRVQKRLAHEINAVPVRNVKTPTGSTGARPRSA